jgi:hypothetical protein
MVALIAEFFVEQRKVLDQNPAGPKTSFVVGKKLSTRGIIARKSSKVQVQILCILQLLSWEPYEIAILPGVISLVAGIMMWVTSLGWVRQKFFELFFYTHQLYIVFMVFMALHVGDFLFSIAFVGFFLFVFDRFLRFCQSRSAVGVLSVKLLPCGTYELVLAKPQGKQVISILACG